MTPLEAVARMIQTAKLVEAGGPELQDRVETIQVAGATLLAVADGSGGMSGGAAASRKVMELLRLRSGALPHDVGVALCREV